jgi:ferritin-like metal-binding protein YciE
MAISTLHDLLLHEMKDAYSAERQLVQALPLMTKKATSERLKQAMETHLGQTEQQVERLKKAFELMGKSPSTEKCKGMEGLITEGKELADKDIEPEALDAALIAAAQRIEHYEIAAYGTMCEYARALGLTEVRSLFEQTLEEEKDTDQLLSGLAEGGINQMAESGARSA